MQAGKIIDSIRFNHKNTIYFLMLITGIAIFLRSLPAWTNAAWGCDFGIYLGLTNSFVENGQLFSTYYGWGESYQYFPVLYAITGFVHIISGIDIVILLPRIAPIFGGLSVLIFYFVVKEIISNKKIALMSSLFLAVLPFHAYQTSLAAPMTMGHFFIMLSLYFFLKYRKDKRYILPLLVSSILLIMSHHLTTYFFLIILISIVFIENISKKNWQDSIKKDAGFILIFSFLMFGYWIIVAKPVYYTFMNFALNIGSISLPSYVVLIFFYLSFFLIFYIISLKRKYNIKINFEKLSKIDSLFLFFLTITLCGSIMIIFSVLDLPDTNFRFTTLSILYSIPLLLVFGLATAGFKYTSYIKNGLFIRGWIIAILLSFLIGLITSSKSILPHRHLEYLMPSLSILAIYGIKDIFLNHHLDIKSFRKKYFHIPRSVLEHKGINFNRKQIAYVIVIIVIASSNAVSIYSIHSSMNVAYPGITDNNLYIKDWVEENLDKNTTCIASDHRICRIIESSGFNTTNDKALNIWSSVNLSEYIYELYGINNNNTKITHIIIDDIMRYQVVNPAFRKAYYMTNSSYDKFKNQTYEMIYRNVTYDKNNQEIHWVEIYKVNWSYVDQFFAENIIKKILDL